jgi:hypothetical protein
MYPILDAIGSDCVFLFASAVSLLTMLWVEQTGLAERRPLLAALGTSAMILLAVATRATGLALVLAFGLAEAVRAWHDRRIRTYAALGTGFLAAGVILYNVYVFSNAAHYGNQFSLNPRLIAQNVIYYLRMAASLWSSAPALLRYLLAGTTMTLALISLCNWRRWKVLELYLLVFLGMLGVYTISHDFRDSLPILPILLFLAARMVLVIGKKAFPQRPAAPALIFGALALIATTFNVVKLDTAPLTDGVGKPAFRQVADFLAGTARDTLILSWNPRVFAFYTRHPSALYPQTAENFENQIPSAQHVLLVEYAQPLDQQKLGPFLAAAGPSLPLEYSNPEFKVYRLR